VVHYRVHNSPPLVIILNQINTVHAVLTGLIQINIILHSYNNNQRDALIWYRTLHVSDRFTVHHQESTVYTALGVCHTGYAD